MEVVRMASPLSVGDVVMVRLNSNDGESKVFNILHYQLTDIAATSGPPPTSFADGSGCSSENMTLEGASVQQVSTPPRSELITFNFEIPAEGTLLGDMLPTQDAVTILKRTGIGERWGMGRLFHSGIPEDNQDKGRVDGVLSATLTNYADNLAAQRTSAILPHTLTWRPVLYTVSEPPGQPAIVRVSQITRMYLSDNVIKTQRRRRPGKGI
jgi:hypothetical protein